MSPRSNVQILIERAHVVIFFGYYMCSVPSAGLFGIKIIQPNHACLHHDCLLKNHWNNASCSPPLRMAKQSLPSKLPWSGQGSALNCKVGRVVCH